MKRALVPLLLVAACASSRAASTADDAGSEPPSFGGPNTGFPEDASAAKRAAYVFSGCAGGPESACHGIGSSGMYLPDTTPTNLVGVPSHENPNMLRVAPGDPEASYLWHKVTGAPDIDGGRMPLDLAPLDTRSLAAIHEWIEAGAPPP